MKMVLKSLIFSLIFGVLFIYVFKILWFPKGGISYFYRIPKDSMDIVYIGASNACSGFNPLLAYDLYGYKTGMLCEGGSPFFAIEYLLKEAQKTQNPNLYVIDIYMLAEMSNFIPSNIRKTTDSMKFNKNRFDAINKILNYYDVDKKEYINYYFSFFYYHNSWKSISRDNFSIKSMYMGYWYYEDIFEKDIENYIWTDDELKLPSLDEKILVSLIEYIKTNNLNVLFVVPKRWYWYPHQEQMNNAISIIEDNGLKVINFNKIDEVNIDFATDFYDKSHLNIYGSTKYTLYFSDYLNRNYNIDYHKNSNLDLLWKNKYEEFKEAFKNTTGENFDEFVLDETKNMTSNK